ncbi:MAG: hypothetical protein ACREDO_07700 [Methyloceanibacter sp.]
MIEWVMFGALGFFLGCLLALMLASPLWNRAVKLTTRRLEATMPMSLADIQADKDQLRAEFAIELRKLEMALDKSKEKAARELIEANKRRVDIQVLNNELAGVRAQLQENENANRVLQQTIKRRLPDLDSRLKAAKKALADLETVNTELRNTVASQSEALKIARATVHNQRADIDRLRVALESGSASGMRGSSKADARAVAESQRLNAELSRTLEELERARTSAQENAFLRRELTRLASQILTITRNQGMQAHLAVEMTQAFADYSQAPEAPPPDAAWQGIRTGNGTHPEPEMGQAPEAEAAPPHDEQPEEQYEPAEEQDPPAEEHAPPLEAHDEEGEPDQAGEGKTSLAKRFAARRAKRADKSSVGSLTARLRGLSAEASDGRS